MGKINRRIVSMLFATTIAMNSLIIGFANTTINDIKGHIFVNQFLSLISFSTCNSHKYTQAPSLFREIGK